MEKGADRRGFWVLSEKKGHSRPRPHFLAKKWETRPLHFCAGQKPRRGDPFWLSRCPSAPTGYDLVKSGYMGYFEFRTQVIPMSGGLGPRGPHRSDLARTSGAGLEDRPSARWGRHSATKGSFEGALRGPAFWQKGALLTPFWPKSGGEGWGASKKGFLGHFLTKNPDWGSFFGVLWLDQKPHFWPKVGVGARVRVKKWAKMAHFLTLFWPKTVASLGFWSKRGPFLAKNPAQDLRIFAQILQRSKNPVSRRLLIFCVFWPKFQKSSRDGVFGIGHFLVGISPLKVPIFGQKMAKNGHFFGVFGPFLAPFLTKNPCGKHFGVKKGSFLAPF